MVKIRKGCGIQYAILAQTNIAIPDNTASICVLCADKHVTGRVQGHKVSFYLKLSNRLLLFYISSWHIVDLLNFTSMCSYQNNLCIFHCFDNCDALGVHGQSHVTLVLKVPSTYLCMPSCLFTNFLRWQNFSGAFAKQAKNNKERLNVLGTMRTRCQRC